MTHFDDVGAYLLGALSDGERASFEAELAVNDALRAEVDYLRIASDALPASPEQMAPPAGLKDRIMAVVNSEAELLEGAQRPVREEPRTKRTLAVLRPGWWSMRPGLAVAMTLLVLVLGASGALVGEAVLGGGGERLTSAELGDAQLIQRKSGHSTLTATGLAPLEDGRVYQVWLKHDGEQPTPTNALFSPHSSGTTSVDVPGSLKGVEEVLVTNEPEGGSPEPTTDAVIVVRPA